MAAWATGAWATGAWAAGAWVGLDTACAWEHGAWATGAWASGAWQCGEVAPPVVPPVLARGGDDVPRRHPGWNKQRATLKRKREEEFTAQIRDIYRELTNDPQTAPQAEAILAPVVPSVTAAGESEAAHLRALDRRAAELRRRADALETDAVQAEIALRLLYRNLCDTRDDDDCAALRVLLPEVL
jgi:hypothetical protein